MKTLNNKGFSLMNMIVSMGVSLIAMGSIGAVFYQVMQQKKLTEAEQEIHDIINNIQLQFATGETCTQAFRNMTFNENTDDEITNDIRIYDDASETLTDTVLVGPNMNTQHVDLHEMKLVASEDLGSDLYGAFLNITFNVRGSNHGKQITRRVGLNFDLASTLINECATGTVEEENLAKSCELVYDGAKTFNPLTRQCEDRYVTQWFNGDKSFASCPDGWEPAVDTEGRSRVRNWNYPAYYNEVDICHTLYPAGLGGREFGGVWGPLYTEYLATNPPSAEDTYTDASGNVSSRTKYAPMSQVRWDVGAQTCKTKYLSFLDEQGFSWKDDFVTRVNCRQLNTML